jgi:hypothetical protein
MPLNAKLGCLKTAERMPDNPVYDSEPVRWRVEYDCKLVKFQRPADGVSRLQVDCPVCGYPLAVDVASAHRVQMKFLAIALLSAAVVAAAGWSVFTTFGTHRIGRPAGLGLLALGGVSLAITVLLGLVKPSVFDVASDALSIAQDRSRGVDGVPGRGGVQAHKLIQVWIKPDEALEPAASKSTE